MLKNHNHDLVQQLSEVSDSLWRMEDYLKNAKGCEHCTAMWNKSKERLEEVSKMLVDEIGRHYSEKRFD